MRYHSVEHRSLTYRGTSGDDLVFECHGDDGRTYILCLTATDARAVADRVRSRDWLRDEAG